MNGFSIILIISILAEIVIYLRNIRYIKSYLTTNNLEQLYKFYKEIENEKDKRTIFKEETFNTLNSNKNTLFLSIIACVFASYMNQDNYLIYSLGFVLVLVSTIKYILIKRYIYDLSGKINFKNKEIE